MPLPSFLQRLRGKAASAQSEAEQPPLSASDVEATRVRARRRLIGMVVLVGVGIIGFPWLFETQPRPMSPDIQMVRTGDAPEGHVDSGATGKVARIEVPVETPVADQTAPDEAVEEIVSTVPPVRATPIAPQPDKPAPKPEVKPEVKPEPKPVAKVEPKVEPKAKPEPKPAPKPEPKPEPKVEAKPAKAADADGTRFVVQVGAYSDGITAYEARMKVERLGLKTYTQEVKTPQGTRIRVRLGPYGDRAEAEKVLAKVRKTGLGGAVLTL
ncbi:MAG: SPOR domain-containing protein [Aquabacterium sp.]|jgi:DedD protein|uniref:SPOR domain-containing protein n=1 Tax=Aquabacterium sp. TaxID=1872578 RepID=UPI002A36A16A|nr:SPOR domain-containing protein [Aquabacterium sp.]MDX9845158.1 SPOR domain-containing protein [Aquabacterium sp.]